MRIALSIIGLVFISGCFGCPGGMSVEEAMANCNTVSELENLKKTCLLNPLQIRKINERKLELYFEQNPNLSNDIKDCILNNKIRIGMTKEQVLLSWGSPSDINKTVGSWGTHEQWVYNALYGPYLYFEDGILTSWQD